jgi:hypothetical protein
VNRFGAEKVNKRRGTPLTGAVGGVKMRRFTWARLCRRSTEPIIFADDVRLRNGRFVSHDFLAFVVRIEPNNVVSPICNRSG